MKDSYELVRDRDMEHRQEMQLLSCIYTRNPIITFLYVTIGNMAHQVQLQLRRLFQYPMIQGSNTNMLVVSTNSLITYYVSINISGACVFSM